MRPSDGNAVPRRSVFEKLLVKKWEYSFPRAFLGLRLAIGVILDAVGILLLPHTHLALLPLAFAALAFVFGPYIAEGHPDSAGSFIGAFAAIFARWRACSFTCSLGRDGTVANAWDAWRFALYLFVWAGAMGVVCGEVAHTRCAAGTDRPALGTRA